jgi:hypothetical protein
MAASGGGPRGVGEPSEAIGAALSTGAAARRAQVCNRKYFQRLTCAFAQLFLRWFSPQRSERPAGHVLAGGKHFAPGWVRRNSRDRFSDQKDASRRLAISESVLSVFKCLRRHSRVLVTARLGVEVWVNPARTPHASRSPQSSPRRMIQSRRTARNVRGVSWSVLRGRCAAPQDKVVGSYESFPALNAKVPAARPPPVSAVELIGISEKQYQVPARLGKTLSIFLIERPQLERQEPGNISAIRNIRFRGSIRRPFEDSSRVRERAADAFRPAARPLTVQKLNILRRSLFRSCTGAKAAPISYVSDFIADYGLVRSLRPEYPARDRSPCRNNQQ